MQYRQGDVLLVQANVELGDWKEIARGDVTLAEGEATGHAHTMTGKVTLLERNEQNLIFVKAPTELTHQEHASIEVAPGMYFVVRQREYTPKEVRRVAD